MICLPFSPEHWDERLPPLLLLWLLLSLSLPMKFNSHTVMSPYWITVMYIHWSRVHAFSLCDRRVDFWRKVILQRKPLLTPTKNIHYALDPYKDTEFFLSLFIYPSLYSANISYSWEVNFCHSWALHSKQTGDEKIWFLSKIWKMLSCTGYMLWHSKVL